MEGEREIERDREIDRERKRERERMRESSAKPKNTYRFTVPTSMK